MAVEVPEARTPSLGYDFIINHLKTNGKLELVPDGSGGVFFKITPPGAELRDENRDKVYVEIAQLPVEI